MNSLEQHTVDRGVDVALAEYDALRQEIVSTRQIQATFIGLGFTAIGLIFTFALDSDDDRQLLLAVPAVALVVEFLCLGATYRIHLQGQYISGQLWPYLRAQTGYTCSWESTKTGGRKSITATVAAAVLADVSVLLLLLFSAAAALLIYGESNTRSIAGWFAIGVTLAVAIGVAVAVHRGRVEGETPTSPTSSS